MQPIPGSDSYTAANKWLIAVTVMFGAFMAVMDISVVNVAVPHMQGAFSQSLSNITWVATSYSIAEIIMITMAGWFSTLIGRKRLYLASMAVFTLGSILSGTAQSFTQMLIYRSIQGLGGGALIPVSQAILRETFPEDEQGMAMAVYSMAVVLAPMVGPILGGYLTDHFGWPWIFYINVPVAIPAMLMILAVVHDPPYLRRGVKRIDWVGIVLMALGLTFLQIVLERGQQDQWLSSHFIDIGIAITVFSLAAFIIWEFYNKEPIFNLRLLKNVPLAAGSVIAVIFGIGLSGSSFILPQLTQRLLGYTAYQSGLVTLPRALALFCLMPLAGWLYKFLDGRLMILAGLCLLGLSYYDLAHLSLHVDFWSLAPMLFLMGAGLPFMFVTLSTLSLSRVKRPDMTDASSIYTLARRVGGNVGYALVATIVAYREQFHRSRLVGNVSLYNPTYLQVHARIVSALEAAGQDVRSAQGLAMGVINNMVNRQASIMAYNDVSFVLGMFFVLTPPLLIFLPGRCRPPVSQSQQSPAAPPQDAAAAMETPLVETPSVNGSQNGHANHRRLPATPTPGPRPIEPATGRP